MFESEQIAKDERENLYNVKSVFEKIQMAKMNVENYITVNMEQKTFFLCI